MTRVKREALGQVTPYGLPGSGGLMAVGTRADAAPMAQAAAPGAATSSTGASAFSQTNNQEVGVDEADVVKTDGRLMVVLRQAKPGVQVIDVAGSTPRLRGFFPMPQVMYGGQLLLVDGRAVVVGPLQRQSSTNQQWTRVLVLSLADPSHPKQERSFDVEGTTVAAREVDGRVLLVTQNAPEIAWTYPTDGSSESQREALRENRTRIRHSPLHAWLPSVTALRTGRTYRPACSDGLRPQSESGTATTTLVSLDPSSDVPGTQAVVQGSGAVVYASTRSVYVTTWPWEAQTAQTPDRDERDVTTSIHRFDVSRPSDPTYAASGSVPGTLIGQYAMSEHHGALRVATTLGRTWAAQEDGVPPSDNLVTVLDEDGDKLVKVGQLRGLGRGERIYGVRFVGPLGYVVTFRQTDPLHVIDLSDPRHPQLKGALHVTGYSSYLHPLDDGLLLGIGQEVEANRPQGTQVSTFDVSEPAAPTLHARKVFPGSHSAAEADPHALLWWPATRQLVVPLESYEQEQSFTGALVLRVGTTGGLVEVGRVEHPQPSRPDDSQPGGMQPQSMPCCYGIGILRSVVVGDELLTLSEQGVMASDLGSLEERAWLPYG
jgi:hypothetical protein